MTNLRSRNSISVFFFALKSASVYWGGHACVYMRVCMWITFLCRANEGLCRECSVYLVRCVYVEGGGRE